MKKIIQLIFICFLMPDICALNDTTATTELTEVFDSKKPIDVILLSRDVESYSSIDIDHIALMFACLEFSIHPTRKTEIRNKLEAFLTTTYSNTPVGMPNITKYFGLCQPILQGRKADILTKFDTYDHKWNLGIVDSTNKWKLVVLNEMFFSKITPLTRKEVDEIKNVFFHFLGEKDERVILYVNFLYTDAKFYDEQERNSLIIRTLRKTSTGMKRMIFKYDGLKDHIDNKDSDVLFVEYLNEIASITDFSNPLTTLFNRSIISYNNNDLTFYDKSTYCWQSNDSLIHNPKHIYYIGDCKDHKCTNTVTYPNLKNLLFKNISSEVCYDLSCGTRHESKWINDVTKTKLHIFISNTTQASGSTAFPNDVPVICVDPKGKDDVVNAGNALTVIFNPHSGNLGSLLPRWIALSC